MANNDDLFVGYRRLLFSLFLSVYFGKKIDNSKNKPLNQRNISFENYSENDISPICSASFQNTNEGEENNSHARCNMCKEIQISSKDRLALLIYLYVQFFPR